MLVVVVTVSIPKGSELESWIYEGKNSSRPVSEKLPAAREVGIGDSTLESPASKNGGLSVGMSRTHQLGIAPVLSLSLFDLQRFNWI